MILKIKLYNPLPDIDTIEIFRYAKHGSKHKHYPVKINGAHMSLRKLNNAIIVKGEIASFVSPDLIKLLDKAIKVHPNLKSK